MTKPQIVAEYAAFAGLIEIDEYVDAASIKMMMIE
jgi:hypothetical protein